MTSRSHRKELIVFLSVILLSVAPLSYFIFKIWQDRQFYWFPDYLGSLLTGNNNVYTVGQTKHVLFLIADHHEHPLDPIAARNSALAWTTQYRRNIASLQDHYGNPLRYSWFYPIDHHVDAVVQILNELVFDGLGEIEFHWHHSHDDEKQFRRDLLEGLSWLNSWGAMLGTGETGSAQFGFVHGNWSLDNSASTPDNNLCGINSEIDLLRDVGSYADFTFSTTRTDAQPRRFSSLYYAVDTPEPKSYNYGQLVSALQPGPKRGYLIFQGPSAFDLRDLTFEHGEIEAWDGFGHHRAKLWVQNAPYVVGRPEWRFIKTYTHGVQSRSKILSSDFTALIQALKDYCEDRGIKLHFVTAREAYNLVKAAEQGMNGDPEEYRDFLLPPPVNTRISANQPLRYQSVGEQQIVIQTMNNEAVNLKFRHPVLDSYSGHFEQFAFHYSDYISTLELDENAVGRLVTYAPVKINRPNRLIQAENGLFDYTIGKPQGRASRPSARQKK